MLVNEYYICYSSNMRNELHILEEFRMLDDAFMILVFEDNLPAVELVLQILTGEEDLTLENMQIQRRSAIRTVTLSDWISRQRTYAAGGSISKCSGTVRKRRRSGCDTTAAWRIPGC